MSDQTIIDEDRKPYSPIRRTYAALIVGMSLAAILATSVQAQNTPFLDARFNDHGWHYDLMMGVPNADPSGPSISLSIDAKVPPGEVPDSVDFMLLVDGCFDEGATTPIQLRAGERLVTAKGRWRSEDGSAVSFSVPFHALESFADAEGLTVACGSFQLELGVASVLIFRRFYRAMVEPDALAKVAVGSEASAADLRQPLEPAQMLQELAAYRIDYDRFRDRYSVAAAGLPTTVLRGADSVKLTSLHYVGRDNGSDFTGLGFAIYGGQAPEGEARMRVNLGGDMDTVIVMEGGDLRTIPGGSLATYVLDTSTAGLAPVGRPTEFQVGLIEVALPLETKRVLGQAFDIARSPETVERWATEVLGCTDLVAMSRMDEPCEMTPDRLEELIGER